MEYNSEHQRIWRSSNFNSVLYFLLAKRIVNLENDKLFDLICWFTWIVDKNPIAFISFIDILWNLSHTNLNLGRYSLWNWLKNRPTYKLGDWIHYIGSVWVECACFASIKECYTHKDKHKHKQIQLHFPIGSTKTMRFSQQQQQ